MELHEELDVRGQHDLLHASRVAVAIKNEICSRLGKNAKNWTGHMCKGCINVISKVLNVNRKESVTSDEGECPQDDAREHGQSSPGTREMAANTDSVYVIGDLTLQDDLRCIPQYLRAKMAYELASMERGSIRHDAYQQSINRNLSALVELKGESYLDGQNPVLTYFVCGLYGGTLVAKEDGRYSVQTSKRADLYRLIKVTEACMGLVAPIATLPFHFRELVIVYSLTRSRMALGLMSAGSPHGSYYAVKSWLSANATEPPTVPGTGDIVGVFDNNQVLQRRWQILVNNTTRSSVVTMIMFINLKPDVSFYFYLSIYLLESNLTPSEYINTTIV